MSASRTHSGRAVSWLLVAPLHKAKILSLAAQAHRPRLCRSDPAPGLKFSVSYLYFIVFEIGISSTIMTTEVKKMGLYEEMRILGFGKAQDSGLSRSPVRPSQKVLLFKFIHGINKNVDKVYKIQMFDFE